MEIERSNFAAPWSESMFQKEEGWPFSHILVACAGEPGCRDVAGYIVYWLYAGELHIHNLAVRKERQRAGIAAALLEEALAHARKEEAKQAFLEVRSSNEAACALYQKNGFRLVGVRKGYYRETGEDALVMSRGLGCDYDRWHENE
jgi:ribosomal-protein-alanine N-acetyltransferase